MSVKKWLNDHNLAVSAISVSLLVIFFYRFQAGLYDRLGFPYFKLENWAQDWIYRLGKTAPIDPRIVFLHDDSASRNLDHLWEEDFEAQPILRKMQKHSRPREVFAAILDRLRGAGAKVVGFDHVFQGTDDTDPIFREALDRNAGGVVVGSQLDVAQFARQLNPPSKTLIPEITDKRVGFVNVFPDADGVVRRFQFHMTREEVANLPDLPNSELFASLPVRIMETAGFGDKVPSGTGRHRIRFAYKGESVLESVRPESMANIFVQSYWESNYQNGEFFRDKIVLVGPTGTLNKDLAESPFGTIGGPEFHLNVMHGILSGSFIRESSYLTDIALIIAGGMLAFVIGRLVRNPIMRIAVLAVAGAAIYGGALWLYNEKSFLICTFSPILCLVSSGSINIVWQQILERREKAKLRHTFERYVSRDVVKELVDNPESFLNSMVGVRKNVTVLFSDVRGFTTITQSGDATQLVAQLNEYFDNMVKIVFANRGTLDKFIGDAVMAQWGGITTSGEKEDAVNAVRTAVQMRDRLVDLNKAWIKDGKLDLKIGIGINHGEAIVGNLGSEAKSEISLIGDAVNTASRFEGMTKRYHVDLIIGERVAALVRDRFILRTVAHSQPTGTLKPIEIFTVIRERANGAVDPDWLASYEDGVKLYREREFAKATEQFETALARVPGDWLCESYLAESRTFAVNPPPPEWNAVDVLTSK